MIASAANGGGTKITVAFAPVSCTPCATVSKTGRSRCFVPPLPGLIPPTTFVPYAMDCSEWNVPSLPVKPWTSNRVFRSTSTLMLCRQLYDLLRGVAHVLAHGKIQTGLQQNLPP